MKLIIISLILLWATGIAVLFTGCGQQEDQCMVLSVAKSDTGGIATFVPIASICGTNGVSGVFTDGTNVYLLRVTTKEETK